MENLLKVENVYNGLVQVDYLLGLCVAFMLGSEKWLLFILLLLASLVLGLFTVKTYIRLQKKIVKEASNALRNKDDER